MMRLFCLGLGKNGLFGFPARKVGGGDPAPQLRRRLPAAPGPPTLPSSLATGARESLANFGLASGSQRWACCSETLPGRGPLLLGAPVAALRVYPFFTCDFTSPGRGWAGRGGEKCTGRTRDQGCASPVLLSSGFPEPRAFPAAHNSFSKPRYHHLS